jgi:hypothetical protein
LPLRTALINARQSDSFICLAGASFVDGGLLIAQSQETVGIWQVVMTHSHPGTGHFTPGCQTPSDASGAFLIAKMLLSFHALTLQYRVSATAA